jgi:hypothetical protein
MPVTRDDYRLSMLEDASDEWQPLRLDERFRLGDKTPKAYGSVTP